MNITVADAGSCLKKISIEILPDEIEKKFKENLRTLGSQVTVPGFRNGKAPMAVLEKKYSAYLNESVHRDLVESALKKARDDNDLDFLSNPEAETIPALSRGNVLKFDVTVEVRPEFELPEYRGLDISAAEATVSDAEIDIFVKNLRMSRGTINPVGEGDVSKAGDILFGDFAIHVDGERVAGRSNGSIEVGTATILGIPVEGADKRFVGLKPTQEPVEESFDVTIPEDFPLANFAGKAANVTVTVKGLARPDYPEVTPEFLQSIGFESEQQMREAASKALKQQKDQQVYADTTARLLDMVISKVNLEIPKQFAERQLSSALQREAFQMYQEGAQDSDIESFIEKRRSELPAHIEKQIKGSFVVDAIAKKERVFVTEEDVQREIIALAQSREMEPQTVADSLIKNNMLPVLRSQIREGKVKHELYRRAKISWKKAPGASAEPVQAAE
jgi:trigger factor